MNIKITVEASADCSAEVCKKYDIEVVPLPVYLKDEEYWDPVDITREDVFNFVETTKQLPRTAATPTHNYKAFFERILKSCDAVLHISFTSFGSANCQNSILAAKELKNVYVIDTLSMSAGIQMLAIKARELLNEGKSLKEVIKTIEKLKSKLKISFIVENLEYLKKGGRCTSLQLLGANIFRIKPSIALIDGKLTAGKKYRGRYNTAVKKHLEDFLERNPNLDKKRCFFGGARLSKEIINLAYQIFQNAGFKEINFFEVGITVACHCGPGTFGIIAIDN